MRYLFYLLGVSVLLSVTGCVIVPGHRDHDEHDEHGDHWEHHEDHGDWHGGDHDDDHDHGDHD